MRRLGDITLDMEELILEMVEDHDLQWGEIRALLMQYLRTHCPESQEEYNDGSRPIDFYGPAEALTDNSAVQLLLEIRDEYEVGRPRRQWKNLMERVNKLFNRRINVRGDNYEA